MSRISGADELGVGGAGGEGVGGGGVDPEEQLEWRCLNLKDAVHDTAKIQEQWFRNQNFQIITELLIQPFISMSKIIFILVNVT